MEDFKQADRRRNVLDIISDLGLRKDQLTASGPAAAASQPATLSLVPAIAPGQVFSDVQRRAAEQRIAAERLLEASVALEERLAREVEAARVASEEALAQELTTSLHAAREAERKAAEVVEGWSKKLERIAGEKREAEALKGDDTRLFESATADVTLAEVRLAEGLRALEIARAACSESDRRLADACAAQVAAHAEADSAAQASIARREERQAIESALHAAQGPAQGFETAAPSTAAIDELHALEVRRRIAERRAADVARGAAS